VHEPAVAWHIHGVDAEGKAVVARKLRRNEVLTFFGKLPSCLVGMEACGSAHYWAREIIKLGHTVKLMLSMAAAKSGLSAPRQADGQFFCSRLAPRQRLLFLLRPVSWSG